LQDPPAESQPDVPRGALYMVGAAFSFAAMGVTVKLASRTLPNSVVVFLRSLLGLVFLAPWLLARSRPSLATVRLKEHLVRGILGMAAMYCFFYAIARLTLADAVLLNYSLPLFVPLIERVALGEPIPRGIWRALALGSCGLMLILKPGLGILQPAALVALFSAVLAASAQVGVRGLTRTEPVTRIVLYFGLVSTLIAVVPAAISWVTPAPSLWPILLFLGFSATIAQLLMTQAYACAPAARVGPFIYTSVVFAAGFDWLFFRKLPDVLSALGALLVAAAGVVTLRLGARALSAARRPA
jgi:drug/metabolite transporter (DMT)-like permease